MQTGQNSNLPKRSRFYQSAIDLNLLGVGMDYDSLKNTLVIFICTFDIFKKGLLRYTFKNICIEDKELALNDETTKIFINTKAPLEDKDISPKLANLIKYINSETISDEYTKKIDEAVKQRRRSSDWRVKYMKYELNLLESKKEGEKKLATLMDLLYKANRFEDIGHAASDEEYKEKLYKEFNIQ